MFCFKSGGGTESFIRNTSLPSVALMTRSNACMRVCVCVCVYATGARNTDTRPFPLPPDGIKVQSVSCNAADGKLPLKILTFASKAWHLVPSTTHTVFAGLSASLDLPYRFTAWVSHDWATIQKEELLRYHKSFS